MWSKAAFYSALMLSTAAGASPKPRPNVQEIVVGSPAKSQKTVGANQYVPASDQVTFNLSDEKDVHYSADAVLELYGPDGATCKMRIVVDGAPVAAGSLALKDAPPTPLTVSADVHMGKGLHHANVEFLSDSSTTACHLKHQSFAVVPMRVLK